MLTLLNWSRIAERVVSSHSMYSMKVLVVPIPLCPGQHQHSPGPSLSEMQIKVFRTIAYFLSECKVLIFYFILAFIILFGSLLCLFLEQLIVSVATWRNSLLHFLLMLVCAYLRVTECRSCQPRCVRVTTNNTRYIIVAYLCALFNYSVQFSTACCKLLESSANGHPKGANIQKYALLDNHLYSIHVLCCLCYL